MPAAPWIQSFHSLGLDDAILASPDADYFIKAATARTGLTDFGDPRFIGPLKSYLSALEGSELSLLGKMLKLQEVLRLLETRLRVEDEVKRHPEILQQEVRTPIFIVSLPRAGSSILFELMAQKSGIRSTQFWEAVEPTPPPESESYQDDPRISSTEDYIESWNRLAPELASKHLVGPTVPVECIQAMSLSFASAHLIYAVKAQYFDSLSSEDWIGSYEYYKKVLQVLQFKTAEKQWLLKSPAHLYLLPELFKVFPDAKVVFIHRDPRTTIASTASVMTTVYRDVFGAPFNPSHYLRDRYADEVEFLLTHFMQTYDSAVENGRTIINVKYRELMEDPVAEVRRIYTEAGLDVTSQDDAAVGAYIRARPKGKYGKHSYSLPNEIDAEDFASRIAPYMAKFEVPEE